MLGRTPSSGLGHKQPAIGIDRRAGENTGLLAQYLSHLPDMTYNAI